MSEMPSIVELLERLARLEADNERLRADKAALRAENEQFKRRFIHPEELAHLPVHGTVRLRLQHHAEQRSRPYLG